MRHLDLDLHRNQILKIRGQLNAPATPLNSITKPLNMRSVVFDRRIARLIRHEAAYKATFRDGLEKWFAKVY